MERGVPAHKLWVYEYLINMEHEWERNIKHTESQSTELCLLAQSYVCLQRAADSVLLACRRLAGPIGREI